jgi:WD40 repeat protein
LYHPRRLYNLLFHAASQTLLTLAADRKRLGTQIGVTALLHTCAERPPLRTDDDLVSSVAYSPKGDMIVTGGYARDQDPVILWNAASGQRIKSLPMNGKRVRCLAFSPDGKSVAVGCRDHPGPVRIWDITTWHEQILQSITDDCQAVVFSPDGKTLATASDTGGVKLWDTETGLEQKSLLDPKIDVWSLAFHPDGKTLAIGRADGFINLMDVKTGNEKTTAILRHAGGVRSLAFTPDGKTLASGSEDRLVKLWDPHSGLELLTLKGHKDAVYAVAFSPDSNTLASACHDGSIKFWKACDAGEVISVWVK